LDELISDQVQDGAGLDIIYGGSGNDLIGIATGTAQVYGGAGSDLLIISGNSNVELFGGAGSDQFIFDENFTGTAYINNFQEGFDLLSIPTSTIIGYDKIEYERVIDDEIVTVIVQVPIYEQPDFNIYINGELMIFG